MDMLKLCFLLLLPLTVYSDAEVTVVKKAEKEDLTQLCINDTLNIIVLIVCKISTERSRGELCPLTYRYTEGLQHGCGSRFTLMTEEQTVFLRLISLTPEDSGNYSCECSSTAGTNITHLSLTVEDLDDEGCSPSAGMSLHHVVSVAAVFIILTVVVLGCIVSHHRRHQTESQSGRPDGEPGDIEAYSTFIRTDSGLYSTAKVACSQMDSNTSEGTQVFENGVYSQIILV